MDGSPDIKNKLIFSNVFVVVWVRNERTLLCYVCSLILFIVSYCQAQLRPVSMLFPDCLPVVEVWLVCCGFTEAKPLAMKIKTFVKLINEQVTAMSCPIKLAV